jgi:3-oxoacyl-[acyl-carrier protein] reductase
MGKVFLIVGATSGMGKALAEQLIKEGHTVKSVSRSGDQAVDLTTDAPLPDIEGPIDGLAYLPGTINLKPIASLTEKDFLDDWTLNVLGAFRVVKHYLPNLKEAEQASIVMISTVAVQQGMPFHASIASAKGGVEGLTRSLAAELAPTIRVNAIAPSLTDTPLATPLLNSDAKREGAAKRHPLHRIGRPEELASAIQFLLSDESSWITGQVLHVDGGLSRLTIF